MAVVILKIVNTSASPTKANTANTIRELMVAVVRTYAVRALLFCGFQRNNTVPARIGKTIGNNNTALIFFFPPYRKNPNIV